MPGCCVVSCKNRIYVNRKAKLSAQGMSFFRVTDKRRQMWNDALLGIASSTNTICSKHFTDDCFYTSKLHIRKRLKSTAMPTIFYQNFNMHKVELDECKTPDLSDNDQTDLNDNVDPLLRDDDDEVIDDNNVEESLIMEVKEEEEEEFHAECVSVAPIDKFFTSIGTQTTPPESAAPRSCEMMKLETEVKNLQRVVMQRVKKLEANVNDLLERLQQKNVDADNMQINMPVICDILEGHFSTFMTDILSQTYSSMRRENNETSSSFNHDHQYEKKNTNNENIQEYDTLSIVEDKPSVSAPATDVEDVNLSPVASPRRATHKQRKIKTYPPNRRRSQSVQSIKDKRKCLQNENLITESADDIFILVIDNPAEESVEQELCKNSGEDVT